MKTKFLVSVLLILASLQACSVTRSLPADSSGSKNNSGSDFLVKNKEDLRARLFFSKFRSNDTFREDKSRLQSFFSDSFLQMRGSTYMDYFLKYRASNLFKIDKISSFQGRIYVSGCDVKGGDSPCVSPPEVWVLGLEKSNSEELRVFDVYEETDSE